MTGTVTFDAATMLDVTTFGAVGNGACDDTAAIVAAGSAALAQGKSLYFPPGVYDITSTMTLRSGEHWVASAGSVTLAAAPTLAKLLDIDGTPMGPDGTPVPAPATGDSLSGFVFQGGADVAQPRAPFVVAYIATNITLDNDTFQNISGIGVLLSNVAGVTIENSSFDNVGNYRTLSGNLVDAGEAVAFCCSNILASADNVVTSCNFTKIGLDAISAGAQDDFVASNNTMEGLNILQEWTNSPVGAAGVYLADDTDSSALNNTIAGASGNGIDLLDDTNLLVGGNTVTGNDESGIAIAGVTNGRIVDNVADNNNQLLDHFPHTAGITVAKGPNLLSSDLTIAGNTATDTQATPTQDWGLQVDQNACGAGVVVTDNAFAGNRDGVSNVALATLTSAVAGEAACYGAGTHIATARGDLPIERLRRGDLIRTAFGRLRPVVWVGRRRIDCRRHPQPETVWPVRVVAHAFAPGRPARDLIISFDHAVAWHGTLIPIRYLINGASIMQCPVERVEYWHVELPAHDLLLAEGLVAESYLDTGNRAAFEGVQQRPAPGGAAALRLWQQRGCAPLLTDGPRLAAAHAALLARAQSLGHRLTAAPGLGLFADGRSVPPFGDLRFRLPSRARMIHLRTRSFVPAHLAGHGHDPRRLGVAVSAIRLDGTSLPLDDARLGAGWHPPEPGWRWTAGNAAIATAGAQEVALSLAITGRYWRD
jgi:parallel beta-helix repeat protein